MLEQVRRTKMEFFHQSSQLLIAQAERVAFHFAQGRNGNLASLTHFLQRPARALPDRSQPLAQRHRVQFHDMQSMVLAENERSFSF